MFTRVHYIKMKSIFIKKFPSCLVSVSKGEKVELCFFMTNWAADWATGKLILNFDLDFSICIHLIYISQVTFIIPFTDGIWKYPPGFCQLSFSWPGFVFTHRETHFCNLSCQQRIIFFEMKCNNQPYNSSVSAFWCQCPWFKNKYFFSANSNFSNSCSSSVSNSLSHLVTVCDKTQDITMSLSNISHISH